MFFHECITSITGLSLSKNPNTLQRNLIKVEEEGGGKPSSSHNHCPVPPPPLSAPIRCHPSVAALTHPLRAFFFFPFSPNPHPLRPTIRQNPSSGQIFSRSGRICPTSLHLPLWSALEPSPSTDPDRSAPDLAVTTLDPVARAVGVSILAKKGLDLAEKWPDLAENEPDLAMRAAPGADLKTLLPLGRVCHAEPPCLLLRRLPLGNPTIWRGSLWSQLDRRSPLSRQVLAVPRRRAEQLDPDRAVSVPARTRSS